MRSEAMVSLGKVVGPHGIRGLVKVVFFSGQAPDLGADRTIELRQADGRRVCTRILDAAAHQHQFLVGLEGVTDRSAAEALTGAEVVVARARLPQPEADSFYWTDLIGLTVATMDGKPLGNLVRILETGANDVYVVRQGKRETLVPALAAVVRRVDLEQRRMWVELPEGL
jgi:16S rRNA processing protein RimM